MLRTVRHLLEMIRFSHTLFALPFALLAAVMAWRVEFIRELAQQQLDAGMSETEVYLDLLVDNLLNVLAVHLRGDVDSKWHGFAFRWQEFLGILLCMVTARSFAMSVNRLADRRLDAANPRTAGRHLPAGKLNVAQVATFAAVCGALFVAATLLFLPNRLPLYLALPVLLFLTGYSYAKRFTALAHVWLGAAVALSPVAAWIAIRGEAVMADPLDLLPALVLGGAVLTWVTGFDIIYACQDHQFDREARLRSVPVLLGVRRALHAAAFCHALTIMLLALLPAVYPPLGWIYGAGVAAVALLLIYEHLLVRPDDLSRVNLAFFHVNAVISLGLLAVGSLDLWLGRG